MNKYKRLNPTATFIFTESFSVYEGMCVCGGGGSFGGIHRKDKFKIKLCQLLEFRSGNF